MGIFSKIKDALAEVQQQNRENAKEKTAPREIFDRMRTKLDQVQEKQQTQKSTKRGRTRGGSENRGSIFSELREHFEQSKQQNKTSKKEETADVSILDRIQKEMEAVEKDKRTKIETKVEEKPDWGSPYTNLDPDDIIGRVLAGAHKEQQSQPKAEQPEQPKKEDDFGAIFDSIMNDTPPTSTRKKTKQAEPVVVEKKKPTFGEIFDQLLEEEKKKPRASSSVTRNATGPQVGGTAMVDSGGSLALRVDPNMGAGTLSKRLPTDVNVRILDYSDRNMINLDGKDTGWFLIDYQGLQGWVLESYLE